MGEPSRRRSIAFLHFCPRTEAAGRRAVQTPVWRHGRARGGREAGGGVLQGDASDDPGGAAVCGTIHHSS